MLTWARLSRSKASAKVVASHPLVTGRGGGNGNRHPLSPPPPPLIPKIPFMVGVVRETFFLCLGDMARPDCEGRGGA